MPSLRVKGLYLAIATIAASFILHFVFAQLDQADGRHPRPVNVPPAQSSASSSTRPFDLYWVIVPVTVLLVLGAANLFRTRIGRAFIAIRDRDISAEVLGIPLLRYKLMSFALSSFYAGVAGGLWAYFFRVVTPESFPLVYSIFFLAAVIVGGMGTILGGILGAVFMTLVPELLKLIVGLICPGSRSAVAVLSPMRTIVFGAADHRLPDLRAARAGRNLAPHPALLPPLALPDLRHQRPTQGRTSMKLNSTATR